MLGLGAANPPVGLVIGIVTSELLDFEGSGFSESKTGLRKDIKEEIHAAGFLIKILKSNLVAFLGALESPGTERRKNPTRVAIAITLRLNFLDIGTSFQNNIHLEE
ncbi:MAG: hypothetical protein ACUVV5_02330 [Candidatus Aminicenantales bacterium]